MSGVNCNDVRKLGVLSMDQAYPGDELLQQRLAKSMTHSWEVQRNSYVRQNVLVTDTTQGILIA